MWALVEDNNITRIFRRAQGFTLNDTQYGADIFKLWSIEEQEAIGLYEVQTDASNIKDDRFYDNGSESFTFADGVVTQSWSEAIAKPLDDVLWAADDAELPNDDYIGQIKVNGLKPFHKSQVNLIAGELLSKTDWYVLRATDGGTAVPANVATYRAAIRTKANEHHTSIDGVSDVDALAALVYDWPTLGS